MAKDGNMKVDTSLAGNSGSENYGIAAALAETLEAAVFADGSAATKAYEMIERYAYTDNARRELKMAHFTMRDPAGQLQRVSIPAITMMPLPLLHVKEATFDLDLHVNLRTASHETTSMYPSGAGTLESETTRKKRQEIRDYVQLLRRTPVTGEKAHLQRANRCSQLRTELGQCIAADKKTMNTAGSIVPSTQGVVGSSFVLAQKTSEEENTTTTHIKVNVKMEQADLPAGIKALLQSAGNSLTVTPIKEL